MEKCDRCGKCCYIFNERGHQIHFQPDAALFHLSLEAQEHLHPTLPSLFLNVRDDFKKCEDGKIRYYVPTKKEILPYLDKNPELKHQLEPENEVECMFLQWKPTGEAECLIHQYNPTMCRNYPENKGGACLNHYERRFTKKFLAFQHSEVDFAVRVLKELHRNKITDVYAWEIVIFLMDFGKFPFDSVKAFFLDTFSINEKHFEQIVNHLAQFTLVRKIETDKRIFLEGISLKEIEKVVDEKITQFGW
jgi:Fe-S-cluster containining protein